MTNPVTQIISYAKDWLTGADISRLHGEAAHKSVKRFSRGNISVQRGRYLDEAGLEKLRAKGKAAYKSLRD